MLVALFVNQDRVFLVFQKLSEFGVRLLHHVLLNHDGSQVLLTQVLSDLEKKDNDEKATEPVLNKGVRELFLLTALVNDDVRRHDHDWGLQHEVCQERVVVHGLNKDVHLVKHVLKAAVVSLCVVFMSLCNVI